LEGLATRLTRLPAYTKEIPSSFRHLGSEVETGEIPHVVDSTHSIAFLQCPLYDLKNRKLATDVLQRRSLPSNDRSRKFIVSLAYAALSFGEAYFSELQHNAV